MKTSFLLSLFLVSTVFANSNPIKAGDYVRYYQKWTYLGVTEEFEYSREVLSCNSTYDDCTVRFGRETAGEWKFQDRNVTLLPNYYGVYDDCAKLKGTYTKVIVTLGEFDVCYRKKETKGTLWQDWSGPVPYGWVKHSFKDVELDLYIELRVFRRGI